MRRRIERTDLDKLREAGGRRGAQGPAGGGTRTRARSRAARGGRGSARRGAAATLRAAIENAAGIYLPDRLHEVRIAVKKLRYAMELARELSGSRAMAAIRTLKQAQDLLGRMHDLEVLIARTRAVQGSPSGTNLRLSGDLDRLVRRLENECRQLHGHYMASRHTLLVDLRPRRGRSSAARRRRAGGLKPWPLPARSISCVTPSPPSAARTGPTTTSVR